MLYNNYHLNNILNNYFIKSVKINSITIIVICYYDNHS